MEEGNLLNAGCAGRRLRGGLVRGMEEAEEKEEALLRLRDAVEEEEEEEGEEEAPIITRRRCNPRRVRNVPKRGFLLGSHSSLSLSLTHSHTLPICQRWEEARTLLFFFAGMLKSL